MHKTHIVGVDPGLVHTGAVSMVFDPDHKQINASTLASSGPDVTNVHGWITSIVRQDPPMIFIEGYRPRSHFGTDARMVKAVHDFKRELGGTVLQNTGVKKVVKQPLMELLGVWKFTLVTHHQDLRSAARIALLGMLKAEHLNRVLTDVVEAHLAGEPWHVHS